MPSKLLDLSLAPKVDHFFTLSFEPEDPSFVFTMKRQILSRQRLAVNREGQWYTRIARRRYSSSDSVTKYVRS